MNDITLCTMHTEKPYYIKEINKNIYRRIKLLLI